MFFTISPIYLGKIGITFITGLLIIKLISNIRINLDLKVVAISLLVPGLILTVLYSREDLIRFIPVTFLILLFPYRFVPIDANLILRTSILFLIFLISTQMLLAIGYDPVVQFRDQWYPIATSYGYGYVDSLIYGFREHRAGGLNYNPNVYASVLTSIYFIFLYSKSQIIITSSGSIRHKHDFDIPLVFITSVVLFSLYLSGSRTYLIIFLIFLLLEFRYLIIKSKVLLPLITFIFIFIVVSIHESVITAFFNNQGSVNVKFSILSNYINHADYLSLLVGNPTFDISNIDTFFDSEYGNWIGRAGFFGLTAVLFLYGLIFMKFKSLFPLLLSFVLMGVGNTVLFGMLTATLAIITFIVGIGRVREFRDSLKYSNLKYI
jgi:hypothetical protein